MKKIFANFINCFIPRHNRNVYFIPRRNRNVIKEIRDENAEYFGVGRNNKIMRLGLQKSLLYTLDTDLRNEINKLRTNLYINFGISNYYKDICHLDAIYSLDIGSSKNIKDIATLRKLKVLTTHEKVYGIENLKYLDKITIIYEHENKYNRQIEGQLKKLIRKNPRIMIIKLWRHHHSPIRGGFDNPQITMF
jgi:hypothetical protein